MQGRTHEAAAVCVRLTGCVLVFWCQGVNINVLSVQVKPVQTPPRIPQVPSVSKVTQVTPMSPVAVPIRTRMATRQQTSAYFEDEDEDMTELQPTFSGPIIKSVSVGGWGGVVTAQRNRVAAVCLAG